MYWRLAVTSIRAQMQYKASFIMLSGAQFFSTGIEIAGIWALFTRFGRLEYWNVAEVCFFYGTVNVAFSIADALATGFDQFGNLYVKTGNFDRLLLRPRSVLLQLMGHELALRRIGRFLQGLAVLGWAAHTLGLHMDLWRVMLFVVTIAGSVCFFMGLFIMGATICFWSTESLELMNTLTYGGVQSAQYPFSIYEAWFRKFFTFVVPLACISYFPVVAILGVDDPLGTSRVFQVMAPGTGLLFLWLMVVIFKWAGVRHYTSTGS
ncbi:MAG TPA: ABC-2 family transporter protein [Pseudomonadales bacterium]|nr:ABC-2 family transporter protein [Pseudomonadales bacterium]